MELLQRRWISGSESQAAETMTDYNPDLVVKEQVVLKQILVCYELILTGESSAFLRSHWGFYVLGKHVARHTG
jgi:hypothetical protein